MQYLRHADSGLKNFNWTPHILSGSPKYKCLNGHVTHQAQPFISSQNNLDFSRKGTQHTDGDP